MSSICYLLNMPRVEMVFRQAGLYVSEWPGPSCSKHCKLNKLISGKFINCCSLGVFKYIDIFVAKMWVAFAMQKLLTFFQQKVPMYLPYFKIELLMSCWLTTSLSFEHLGPDLRCVNRHEEYSQSIVEMLVERFYHVMPQRFYNMTENVFFFIALKSMWFTGTAMLRKIYLIKSYQIKLFLCSY